MSMETEYQHVREVRLFQHKGNVNHISLVLKLQLCIKWYFRTGLPKIFKKLFFRDWQSLTQTMSNMVR